MTLSYRDQEDLTLFFAHSGRHQRSIQGPILEKMWMSRPWANEEVARAYFARAGAAPPAEIWTGRRSGEEITADITSEVHVEPSVEPDLGDLERFGRVLRKLGKLEMRHRVALEVLHGDEGALCADRLKKYGRIVSLFGLTTAGRALARLERSGAGRLKVTSPELIRNAVGKQETQEPVEQVERARWQPPGPNQSPKTWRELSESERTQLRKTAKETHASMVAVEARSLVIEAHAQSIALKERSEAAYADASQQIEEERSMAKAAARRGRLRLVKAEED